MKHLELARRMFETFGAETIAEDSTLSLAFMMLFVKAGVVTIPELIAWLKEDPTMAEFESIAAEAWQRAEGGEL